MKFSQITARNMWPLWLAGAAAGYFYGVQPVAESALVQKVKCTTSRGILLSMGPETPEYVTFLKSTPVNAVRYQYKQIHGCLPTVECAADPFVANRTLARAVTEWKAKAIGFRAKAFAYEKMRDKKGIDLPGIPQEEIALAKAQEEEANWCAEKLENLRTQLPIPHN